MQKILCALVLLSISIFVKGQTISLGIDNEYCPNIEYEFTVTLPKPFTSLSSIVFLITQQPYDFNQANTSFKFKGKFVDVNIKQTIEIRFNNGENVFKSEYKKVKSLFHPKQPTTACPGIVPNQSTITAPLCKISDIPISFDKVKWYTSNENPEFCFGAIATYEYQLPAGWKLNNSTSTGSNWITGTNNVTVTSDRSTGGAIYVRPANNCGPGLANSEPGVPIYINRPQSFAVGPANVSITCGSTTPVTFVINNPFNQTGIADYTWNIGPTPNGWLLPDGSPAPQNYSTGMTNTLKLTPVCGVTQTNISATVNVNGIICNANASIVSAISPSLKITGNSILCSGTTDYTLSNVPCDANVTWTSSNPGIATITSNGNLATLTKKVNGTVTITATVNGITCLAANSTSIPVTIGIPTASITAGTPNGSGSMQGIPFYYNGGYPYWDNINYSKYFEFESLDGHSIFGFPASELMQNPPFQAKGSEVIVDTYTGGSSVYLRARAYNTCGFSDWKYFTIPLNSQYYYMVSPNPANNKITISERPVVLSPTNKKPGITEVKIFDNMGVLKRQVRFSSARTAQVNTSALPTGIYFVEITNGQFIERQQLMMQK